MTPPVSARAMRAALDARIVAEAAHLALDPNRLRRRLVFQRLLRRLEGDERWVLKGGYLLETRLAGGARTTRDLDLASIEAADADGLRASLDAALSVDPDGDFLIFNTVRMKPLARDARGRGGWRVNVETMLDGRVFDRVLVDVVERMTEVRGGLEMIELESPLPGLHLGPARVLAVDVAQHAAEKFHALSRTYAGDRPSTRVKDLVDILLLADARLLPDPRLASRLRAVFLDRDGGHPPPDLPAFPSAWRHDFAVLLHDGPATPVDFDAAIDVAREIYRGALA